MLKTQKWAMKNAPERTETQKLAEWQGKQVSYRSQLFGQGQSP